MPGWLGSAGSGPLTWMLSNATSIAWISQHQRKGRQEKTTRPKPRTRQRRNEMKIKVTSLYVDDQDKALRVYTEVLGFTKKADFRQGAFRWLTVASLEEPDGTQLQLALNNNPAAKAYQQAIFQQGQPAFMFNTDDIKGDYERIKALAAEFTMPPTDVDRFDHCAAERHLR